MVNRVNVNPRMIKWARENAGLTFEDLPATLKNARKWETGELKPTWADLRNLAKKYKRPSYFYCLSEPPKDDNEFIEFRANEKIENFSSELRLEINKAKFRRNGFIKIHNNMGIKLNDFSECVNNEKNPIELGKNIRNFLNLPFESQKQWIENNKDYSHNNFLNHWKEVLFDLNILVFEIENVSEDEISACSLYYDICPIILLNGKNSHNRRIFTLMHELAHLFHGTTAVCDVDKYNKKEAFCNKVAAEILVPESTLNNMNLFTKENNVKLGQLSNIYGLSKQVIVYKLNSSKIINNNLKNKLISEIEEKIRLTKEKKLNSKPMISTVTKKKKYEGIPYLRLVLNAYENNIITSVNGMKYLNVPLDKFKDIDATLWS